MILKDQKSAPPVPVKRRSQILEGFRRKSGKSKMSKMPKNAKHKRNAQSNKFFGRESKSKYLKKKKSFKTTLSSDHGVVSQHAQSGSDVLQIGSKQSPDTSATSGTSLQSLSAHRLPAVPQIEVDADHGDHPFAASLPSMISHYQIEEALYLEDHTPFGTTAIVTTSDITSFSTLDEQDVPLILQVWC